MICHDCGYEIADNLKYCTVCHAMQKNVSHLYGMTEPDADSVRREVISEPQKNRNDSIYVRNRISKYQNHKLLPAIIFGILPIDTLVHWGLSIALGTNLLQARLYGKGYANYINSLKSIKTLNTILILCLTLVSFLTIFSIISFITQKKKAILELYIHVILDFVITISYFIASGLILNIKMNSFHYWKTHGWIIFFPIEFILYYIYMEKHLTYFNDYKKKQRR